MSVLHSIHEPADVRALDPAQVTQLSQEIREYLVASVSTSGGHLGPNLGVVELTIALHRVFDSPYERIIFDTGHQSYVHKLLTGRKDFSKLRQANGISGYPSRQESPHDVVENSHASTSLSWAYGIDVANRQKNLALSLPGRRANDQRVVAVIGDGALTGGMAWEATNMIAADEDCRVVIVVNDNERSYAPTIGGLAKHLSALRTADGYEWTLQKIKHQFSQMGPGGRLALDTLHGMKKGLKDLIAPQTLFEDIGLKYIGPIDGHDQQEVEFALKRAKLFQGPVLVHVITEKGHGYQPAVNNEADQMHAVGPIHPDTGLPITKSGPSWTSLFSDAMLAIAKEHHDVIGITAAMQIPVGLDKMAHQFPSRVLDVGIAEQHAVTMAAGLASQGLRPFVAVYATFLNRAFDQVLMDVALHKEGVTFILDRAGITGPDGASHHGMWDVSMLLMVPGMLISSPRDAEHLVPLMHDAVAMTNHPSAIRLPKTNVIESIPTLARVGKYAEVVVQPSHYRQAHLAIIALGPMVATAVEVAQALDELGIGVTVIDPVWFGQSDAMLNTYLAQFSLIATVEDGIIQGGMGQAIGHMVKDNANHPHVVNFGLPTSFIAHDSREAILEANQLHADGIVTRLIQIFGEKEEFAQVCTAKFGTIQSRSASLETMVSREEQL